MLKWIGVRGGAPGTRRELSQPLDGARHRDDTHTQLEEGGTRTMAHTINMNLRPLHDRIVVKRLEEEEVTRGHIIIPDTAKEKPQQGQVVAVGLGRMTDEGKSIPLVVKAGDRVLFGKYSGSEVTVDSTEYVIMKEDDVLGIVGA